MTACPGGVLLKGEVLSLSNAKRTNNLPVDVEPFPPTVRVSVGALQDCEPGSEWAGRVVNVFCDRKAGEGDDYSYEGISNEEVESYSLISLVLLYRETDKVWESHS